MKVPTGSQSLRARLAALAFVLFVLPAAAAAQEALITLDAEDAYLPSVLKILAEKGNLNIITGPGVTGERLSIHMRDVPVDQAVNLVVRAAGLAYERIGNSILVADAQTLKEETGLSSYVIELQYADALDVQAALQDLSAAIQVDRGGNRLIIVTSPRVIAEIRDVIRVMDLPAQQVMLEARVIEVSTDEAKRLGVDWNLLNRQGFIVVEGSPDPSAPEALPDELPFVAKTPRSNDFTRQAKAFRAFLDLMVRNGSARVLANPKIATLNGRQAEMLIGSRIPFVVTGTAFAGGGAAPVQRVEKEEVGIKLKITPLINADGQITTQIEPEVSSVTGFTGVNADLPVVATRQVSTTVRLKDGSSVIIGGLLSEERQETITKLPVLGSIPGIGYLFQHRNTTVSKKDLVIEVTPRIMPEQ